MHFYMHSYLHKIFILVKSGCYTAADSQGVITDHQGASLDRQGAIADRQGVVTGRQDVADLAELRSKKVLAMRRVDGGGHRSRRMDVHSGPKVGANCHGLRQ
jgi:hypothetical protein